MSVDPYLGEISMFSGTFAPRGWAMCDGQLLSISQNQALFSIIGTIYGGDGRTTFALPDLRSRTPIHKGHGPGLSYYRLGERGGGEYNILKVTQIPSHSHFARLDNVKFSQKISNQEATTNMPSSETCLAVGQTLTDGRDPKLVGSSNIYSTTPNDVMNNIVVDGDVLVGNTGGNQEVNNIQPFLVINYIIAIHGVFPSRS